MHARYLEKMEIEDAIMEDMEEAIDHGILVSNLAYNLSKFMGNSEEFCKKMAEAGMVHDIGKLKLSKYMYGRRKDTLVVEEMKYVRMHSTFSYNIMKDYNYSEESILAVYHHHENYDGSGYPDNLKGHAIPIGARILRTCDVFAALVSTRPYREAFDMDTAIELMIDESKNFDMEIFLTFLKLVHSKEFVPMQNFINEYNARNKYIEKDNM